MTQIFNVLFFSEPSRLVENAPLSFDQHHQLPRGSTISLKSTRLFGVSPYLASHTIPMLLCIAFAAPAAPSLTLPLSPDASCEKTYRLGNIIDLFLQERLTFFSFLLRRSSALLAEPCPGTFGAWLAAAKRLPAKSLSYLPRHDWLLYDPESIAAIATHPIVHTLRAEAEAFAATRYLSGLPPSPLVGGLVAQSDPGLMVVHFRVGDFLRHTNESFMLGLVEAMLTAVSQSGVKPVEIIVLNGDATFDCCSSSGATDRLALSAASARIGRRLWHSLSVLYPQSKMERNPPGNADSDFMLAALSASYLVTGAGSFAASAALVSKGICFSPSLRNLNFPARGRRQSFSLRGGAWRFY